MSRRPQGQWVPLCVFACIVLGIGVLHAATPESEYRQLIRVNQDIQPLGEHPFGERISLADGSLSFTQTDISLSGNGPVLQLVRKFQGEASYAQNVFADWDMAVLHLAMGPEKTNCRPWLQNPHIELCGVSFYRLISEPTLFQGKKIKVVGWLANVFGEDLLFPNESSYKQGAYADALAIRPNVKIYKGLEQGERKVGVTVVGDFHLIRSGTQERFPVVGEIDGMVIISSNPLVH